MGEIHSFIEPEILLYDFSVCLHACILKAFTVFYRASLVAQRVERLPAMPKAWVRSPGQEDPLEEGMATHSSVLVCKIPLTEEPGPQSRKELDTPEAT